VEQVFVTVQEPADASAFELTPESDQTTTGQDSLKYHSLQPGSVPAGLPYSLAASYDLPSGQLSADILGAQQPGVEGPLPVVSDPIQAGNSDFNWPIVAIVAGGLIIIAAVTWFLYTSFSSNRKRTPKPRPRRTRVSRSSKATKAPSSTAGAHFCHNCCNSVDAEDRFCRECGTPLKGR